MAAKEHSKGKTAANAILFVALTIGALGVVNVLSTRYFTRFDMTQEKVYTLSKASKDLVKNLPDRMNVKLFMSEDLKPPFSNHAKFVRDLLADYAAYSNGKLVVEVIKIADGDTKKEEEAAKYKVQKSRRGVMSANKVEIGSTFLGVGFDYHGQIESIPIIEQDQGLEFEISGLIKQMTVKKKKIGFATSEGELPLSHGGIALFDQQLKKTGYETQGVELKAKIPDDVDALIIAGPKQPMSERAKYVVDQFLMGGKAVAFFVDGEVMETPKGMMMPGMDMPQIARANDAGVDDILSHYGFKVKADMILDRQNIIGPVSIGGQLLGVNHPVFLFSTALDNKSPLTTGIEALIFPYASSIELTGDVKDGKSPLKVSKLAASSKRSWRPSGPFVFDPQAGRTLQEGTDKGPFALAYSAEGKFTSFFKGKQIVKEDGSKVDGNVSQPGIEPMLTESKDGARLVVIGDSEFISDQYAGLSRQVQPYIANVVFAMNIADWLALDSALSQVRNKGMQNRPLSQVDDSLVAVIKWANIGGMPVLLLVIGLLRWYRRQSQRKTATL